jgi:MoaA/NifB/PqqE/SkfB family radical SAM enzyme
MCNSECDHCFVYSSPRARGTFTLTRIRKILDDATDIGTVEWVYFEGGEPFLFYPIMLEGIKLAQSRGFKTGVVTNAYFATEHDDIEIWLKPLKDSGIGDLSMSNDTYHYDDENNPVIRAHEAAKKLKLPVAEIAIDKPSVSTGTEEDNSKGDPIIGGSTRFRGRAVEKLVAGLPLKTWQEFKECPYEELELPKRLHIDPYGNVHLCQGLSMGNCLQTPIAELVKNYEASAHPICGPLVKGGPALLASEYGIEHDDGYVDACHFCYLVRTALLDRFPQYLNPRQVYGLE